jgi:hypothetical protein
VEAGHGQHPLSHEFLQVRFPGASAARLSRTERGSSSLFVASDSAPVRAAAARRSTDHTDVTPRQIRLSRGKRRRCQGSAHVV